MSSQIHFSKLDQEQIAAAVKKAESATSGEIVPVIVQASSTYAEVVWKAAFLGTGVGMLLHEAYLIAFAGWAIGFWSTLLGWPLFVFAGALLSVVAVNFLPGYKRLLIGRTAMDESVHGRAIKAFVEHEVFSTRDRTGIVLLVSLFEHRVEVFGDSGINAAVQAEDWSDVVYLIANGIKQGQTTQALVEGIERCGELLQKSGVHILPDDTDELSNLPRFED